VKRFVNLLKYVVILEENEKRGGGGGKQKCKKVDDGDGI
jgi:hypothetical protein